MDSTLTDEQREIRDWVRTFVRKELLLLEPEVLTRERAHEPAFAPGEHAALGDLGGNRGSRSQARPPATRARRSCPGRYQQDSGWPGAWPRRRCLPP